MRKIFVFLLFASSIAARGDPVDRGPVLLHLVGSDSLSADLLLAGTPSQPVYFFRDPDDLRLRVERKGDYKNGFTRTYRYVGLGGQGSYVEIRDFPAFRQQGLQYEPILITINGKIIAGFLESTVGSVETKRLGKKVYAEFKKLPSNFQRVLYNFRLFGDELAGQVNADSDIALDAGETGVLLSEDWASPGFPDYKVTILPADPKDENAVPNFQRLFAE